MKKAITIILLILVVALIAGVLVYTSNTSNETNEISENITTNQVSNENVTNNVETSNNQITLEGTYSMEEASDVGYIFYPNGTVEYFTNLSVYNGTYVTTGENELEINFTEITIWDINTNEETTSKIDRKEAIEVIDEESINIKSTIDGETSSNKYVKLKEEV